MHYAISLKTTEFGFLSITPRKKLLKHCLLRVEDGLALVRLGKHEYAIEPGQAMWLPFDCLTSTTYFPNTTISMVEVSSRVQQSLPKQAGFVDFNELTTAVINRLVATDAQAHETKLELYRVLQAELASLHPKLRPSTLGNAVSQWSPEKDSELSKEIQLVLLVREARRQILSGSKPQAVVEQLFAGDQASFTLMVESICGEPDFKY
ncbi:AraC family transcriptional regulator [Vibrio panuliri]|uniref:AraC family transcriptional regulator n=1 Tax=Vibrio panuliri TaxID=1381081 RepID=A0A1Q9HRD4_9VIBR|nr:AraC family transcriptional regulator [Vibrio panuliri]OLQ93438.1 AraC family transcriptional regulator [Vibrio panuliri]